MFRQAGWVVKVAFSVSNAACMASRAALASSLFLVFTGSASDLKHPYCKAGPRFGTYKGKIF